MAMVLFNSRSEMRTVALKGIVTIAKQFVFVPL